MFLCIGSSDLIEDSLSRLCVTEPNAPQAQVLGCLVSLAWMENRFKQDAGRPTYAGLRDVR